MPEAPLPQRPTAPSFSPLAWLRLMRLPTVFTALSNILCGFLISTPERSLPTLLSQPELWLLLLASSGLYLGGMVLNDVFDADLDRRERPERPIPSGQITKRNAAVFGAFLMAIGPGAALAAGLMSNTGHTGVQIACVLAAAVVLYDAVLKSTVLGPLGMGLCRFLNLMLGASCSGSWTAVWSGSQLMIATALAVYVFGVTWFARHETGEASKGTLLAGLAITVAGIGVNAATALQTLPLGSPATGALIALSLIAANITARGLRAISANQPKILQKTVGFMLLHIIFLDASMTFCLTGSGRLAALIVILVIPATLMKRVIPMS
ncbi:MAG: UbiA family prenyltransferase [Fuerstiella sp.]